MTPGERTFGGNYLVITFRTNDLCFPTHVRTTFWGDRREPSSSCRLVLLPQDIVGVLHSFPSAYASELAKMPTKVKTVGSIL